MSKRKHDSNEVIITAVESPRRPVRERKTKSALELLGISPAKKIKTEPNDDADSMKNARKAASGSQACNTPDKKPSGFESPAQKSLTRATPKASTKGKSHHEGKNMGKQQSPIENESNRRQSQRKAETKSPTVSSFQVATKQDVESRARSKESSPRQTKLRISMESESVKQPVTKDSNITVHRRTRSQISRSQDSQSVIEEVRARTDSINKNKHLAAGSRTCVIIKRKTRNEPTSRSPEIELALDEGLLSQENGKEEKTVAESGSKSTSVHVLKEQAGGDKNKAAASKAPNQEQIVHKEADKACINMSPRRTTSQQPSQDSECILEVDLSSQSPKGNVITPSLPSQKGTVDNLIETEPSQKGTVDNLIETEKEVAKVVSQPPKKTVGISSHCHGKIGETTTLAQKESDGGAYTISMKSPVGTHAEDGKVYEDLQVFPVVVQNVSGDGTIQAEAMTFVPADDDRDIQTAEVSNPDHDKGDIAIETTVETVDQEGQPVEYMELQSVPSFVQESSTETQLFEVCDAAEEHEVAETLAALRAPPSAQCSTDAIADSGQKESTVTDWNNKLPIALMEGVGDLPEAILTWTVEPAGQPESKPSESSKPVKYRVEIQAASARENRGSRAKPSKHYAVSSTFQEMVDNLKPIDDISCHVTYNFKTMSCKYCDKILTDRHMFRRHILEHPDIKFRPWKCPLCPYAANIKAQIARHINIHADVKPFVCKECGKGFNFKQKLALHMKYHLNVRDSQCPHCDMAFHEYKTLKNHLFKIHGIVKMPKQRRKPEKDEDSTVLHSKPRRTPKSRKTAPDPIVQPVSGTDKQVASYEIIQSDASGESMIRRSSRRTSHQRIPVSVDDVEEDDDNDEDYHPDKDDAAMHSDSPLPNPDSLVHSGVSATVIIKPEDTQDVAPIETDAEEPAGILIVLEVERADEGGNPGSTVDVVVSTSGSDLHAVAGVAETNGVMEEAEEKPTVPVVVQHQEEPVQAVQVLKKSSTHSVRRLQRETYQFQSEVGKIRGLSAPPNPFKVKRKVRPPKAEKSGFRPGRYCRVKDISELEPSLQPYCEILPNTVVGERHMIFKCKVCETLLRSKTEFITHLEKTHREVKAWDCPHCDYKCRLRSSIIVHMKCHSDVRQFDCEMCGKTFKFKQKLQSHMKYHLNLREHKCSQCPKTFNDKYDLSKHIKFVHIADRPYVCQICSKRYKSKPQLRNHMESHSAVKKYLCLHCNKRYRSPTSLAQHMKSHTCMFHCEICNKSFGSYSGFMAHKVMHDESYGGYHCSTCDKVLHTKGSLARHCAVVHTNVRSYACDHCDKKFKTKKDLKGHQMRFNLDLTYACNFCSFTATQADLWNAHLATHGIDNPEGSCIQVQQLGNQTTKELQVTNRPLTCGTCNQTFQDKDILLAHIREHVALIQNSDGKIGDDNSTLSLEAGQVEVKSSSEDSGSQTADKAITIFMCEECNSVFLSQDNLAVHILAEHMRRSWAPAEATAEAQKVVVLGGDTLDAQLQEVIIESPELIESKQQTMESLQEVVVTSAAESSDIGCTVELLTVDSATAAPAGNHTVCQNSSPQTTETLVSIAHPGEQKSHYVTLVHPIITEEHSEASTAAMNLEASSSHNLQATDTDDSELSAQQKFSELLYEQGVVDHVINISGSADNQMLVANVQQDSFQTMLAAAAAGEAHGPVVTVETNGGDAETLYVVKEEADGSHTLVLPSDQAETYTLAEPVVQETYTSSDPAESDGFPTQSVDPDSCASVPASEQNTYSSEEAADPGTYSMEVSVEQCIDTSEAT